MEKTIYEQMGGTYTQQGNYLLPNVKLPEQEDYEIGVWGNRRRQYLKKHHRVKYYNMLTQCTLYPHLADVNAQAVQIEETLVKQLAEREGVTEQLKATDIMAWVRRMNNIRNRVQEIVLADIIYCDKKYCLLKRWSDDVNPPFLFY